jgi:hypothetical protein
MFGPNVGKQRRLNSSKPTLGKIQLVQMANPGKLTNPDKRFFLQLVVDSVEDVNKEVDCNNMSYARKAMIRCGMALDVDGSWSVNQLFPHLQDIVAKHVQYFQGQDVPDHVRAG